MTQVSELLTVKIENTYLKLQQLQAQANAIVIEQNRLVEEARAEVSAPAGHIFNTDTRLFQSPDGEKPLSTPQRRQAKRAKH